MPRSERNRPRLRLERLHEHPAGRVPPAPAGELRDELEGALLGAEVWEAEPCIGVDHRGELDACEVLALRHHLRPDQHCPVGGGEAAQRRRELSASGDCIGVEPKALELRHALLELALEALRPRPDASELDRAAGRARLRRRLREAAVMTVEPFVAVQHERDVAVRAAMRLSAGPAVQGGRHAAAVEEQDCLPAALGERAELLQ